MSGAGFPRRLVRLTRREVPARFVQDAPRARAALENPLRVAERKGNGVVAPEARERPASLG